MAQDRKKQVSGEIPFHFMQEMGHSPRAMEQFFDLPYQARQVLTDAVCISDEPEERRETALKSLANGGEGYCRTVLTAFPARTAVLCGAAVLLYSPKYAVLTSFISNRFSLR